MQNLLGNTGTVNRGTDPVQAHAYAGPAALDKSATVSTPQNKWTNNGDSTYTTFVILETNTLTTRAHIDALPNTGTPPSPGEPGGGPGTPTDPGTAAYAESASGYAAQTIQAQTKH